MSFAKVQEIVDLAEKEKKLLWQIIIEEDTRKIHVPIWKILGIRFTLI